MTSTRNTTSTKITVVEISGGVPRLAIQRFEGGQIVGDVLADISVIEAAGHQQHAVMARFYAAAIEHVGGSASVRQHWASFGTDRKPIGTLASLLREHCKPVVAVQQVGGWVVHCPTAKEHAGHIMFAGTETTAKTWADAENAARQETLAAI